MLLATLVVPKGATVVVIAPPWSEAGEPLRIVAEAGGTFVANGRFPWIAVAHSNAADFASNLIRNGAWLVLDPALAAGCLARNNLGST